MEKKEKQVLEILEKYQKKVFPLVLKHLLPIRYPTEFSIPREYQKVKDFHWETIKEYPLRKGKYLRPSLLLLCCGGIGGEIKQALNTASAMQLSEEWMLVHDDCEDESLQRRGKATLPVIYSKEIAINTGDGLQNIMWKAILDNREILDSESWEMTTKEFLQMIERTILGQTAEFYFKNRKLADFSENDYFFIVDGKTAYYSIAGPLRLGAMIAKANFSQIEIISKMAKYLGRAYQIRDDILDIEGTFEGRKKQKSNDLYESKKTLILFNLYRKIPIKEADKLERIIKKKREEKSKEEIKWIEEKIIKFNILEDCKKTAEKYRKKAKDIFWQKMGFFKNEPFRREFIKLMEFITERQY